MPSDGGDLDTWEPPLPTSGALAYEKAKSQGLGPRPASSGRNALKLPDGGTSPNRIGSADRELRGAGLQHLQRALHDDKLMRAVSRRCVACVCCAVHIYIYVYTYVCLSLSLSLSLSLCVSLSVCVSPHPV